MSKLDDFAASKPMQALQKVGIAIQSNKAISAVSQSMMLAMGLIMAGSIFTIVATVLYLAGLVQTTDTVYQLLSLPNSMTLGIISLVIAFAVGYLYSRNLGLSGDVSNGIVTSVLFLIVVAPVQSVTLEDGSTMSVIDSTYLGSTGMFTAILVALVSVRIIGFCQDKHIVIQLPDIVPQFLSDSFSSLIPLVICILLWGGISQALSLAMGVTLPALMIGLLAAPLAGLTSVPGMIVLNELGVLLWGFGIHGSAAIYTVTMPVMFQVYAENAELFAAGEALQFNATFLGVCAGSSAELMLPFILMCAFRAKSEQLRAVGKASAVPALFNITEPITFGAPIMGNPLLILPQLIGGIIWPIAAWALYSVGFFQPGYILLLMNMPYALQEFLPALAWQNLLIAPLGSLIGAFVFYPFFKVYDKQLCEREAADAAAELEA